MLTNPPGCSLGSGNLLGRQKWPWTSTVDVPSLCPRRQTMSSRSCRRLSDSRRCPLTTCCSTRLHVATAAPRALRADSAAASVSTERSGPGQRAESAEGGPPMETCEKDFQGPRRGSEGTPVGLCSFVPTTGRLTGRYRSLHSSHLGDDGCALPLPGTFTAPPGAAGTAAPHALQLRTLRVPLNYLCILERLPSLPRSSER